MMGESERSETRSLSALFYDIPVGISVRGLTWGSPKFNEVVKRAEELNDEG